MNITKVEMTAAFLKWKNNFKANPDDFMDEEEQIEAGTKLCSEYSMEYFVKLIKENRNDVPSS